MHGQHLAIYRRPSYKDEKEDFFTHIITQNDKMMDCVSHFHTILDTIPQSDASFRIAKEGLTKQLASLRTTKFGLINAWIAARNLGIDYDLNEKIYAALPDLTMQDIVKFASQQVAHKYPMLSLANTYTAIRPRAPRVAQRDLRLLILPVE